MTDFKNNLKEFNRIKGFFTGDTTVSKYFQTHYNSTSKSDVLIKLNECLNHSNLQINLSSLATFILDLNLNKLLKLGDVKAVQLICEFSPNSKNLCEIASRYCNWHNANAYAIYDERALQLIDSQHVEVSYATFLSALSKKRSEMGLEGLNYREFDKFLWLFKSDL